MSKITLKNRRLAVENSKWRVYLDHIADAAGNEVPDYLIIAAHNTLPGNITGVAVLPVVDGNFLLLRSYRHGLASNLWELPRGFLDPQETAISAAHRELHEETNLTCQPDDMIPLGHYAPEPATMAARGALFAARNCQGIPKKADDELGLDELQVFKPDEIARLISQNEIEDAGTLIAYYRYCAIADR